MKFEETSSVHLPDEELITLLYLGDVAGSHASQCSACADRLLLLRSTREKTEREQFPTLDIRPDRLAAQRRAIYGRLPQAASPWLAIRNLKTVSAAALAVVVASGLFVYHDQKQAIRQAAHPEDIISDVDLAREVSMLSQNTEAAPAEPLQGLFE